jgi:N-acetylglucosamine-6-phosphate deacetylase
VRRINAYRYAGIIEAAFLLDDMMVEIIADGKHLPASLLKLIYKIKGPDRICLVTDAIDAAGLKGVTGELYSKTLGSNIVIEDDVAKLPDRSAFAGSVATTDRLVRTMIRLADVPLYQAVKMMSATPAKAVGMFSRKGSLSIGKDADIIIFDDDIDISTVIVGGEVTFEKS